MVLLNQNQSTLLTSGFRGKILHYEVPYLKRMECPLQTSLEKPPADSSVSWINKVFNHRKVRSRTLAENPRDGDLWYVKSYSCCQQFGLQLLSKYYFEYFTLTSNKTI